jgi:hypothetical protein
VRLAIMTVGFAAAAAAPGAALAQASAKKTGDLAIVGLTDLDAQSIEVPPQVQKAADAVYAEYRESWEVPRIDTLLDGKPVIFYMRRTPEAIKAAPRSAATAYNYAPFGLTAEQIDSPFLSSHTRVCHGMFTLRKQENWCKGHAYSVRINEDRALDWYFPMLLSHEFLHLRTYEIIPKKILVEYYPYWVSEGLANGFGFGLVEHFPGLSREGIARKTAMLQPQDNRIAAFLGLRYYDHPLPLIGEFAETYPSNHPAYPSTSDERWQMASYGSGSFFRHILKGRKHGLNAIDHLLRRAMPSAKAWRPWVRWLDEGLKTATARDSTGAPLMGADGKPLKIWPRGIRQVYAEMIADMADFPDRVAKHRVGRLVATTYDSYLWSKGCETVDLTFATSWTKTLEIAPMAARCLRVKLPPAGLDMSGTDAALITPNLPPSFAITATSSDGGCNDLEAATRGEVLPELMRFKGTQQPDKCIAKWLGFYLPLNINDPQGLKGFQTLVLSNVADDAALSQPRRIEVTIVNPQVNGVVEATQTVEQGERKIKKPIPKPKPKPKAGPGGKGAIPQMGMPQTVEPEPPGYCDPDQQAIFECGDIMTISFAYGDPADVMVEMEAMRNYVMIDMLPAAFSPDGEDSIAKVIAASKGDSAMAGMMPQSTLKMAAGQGEGGGISIKMQRLAPGQTGTFPAQVKLDWTAPGGFEGGLASLAPARLRPAGDCVVVTAMRATGQVTITRNSEGLLMGSVTAQFFEPNPDDAAACRTPYVAAGTAQFDFTLGGIVTVGDLGDYEPDMDQLQKAGEARLANAMATGVPAAGADYGGADEEGAGAGRASAPSSGPAQMPGGNMVGAFGMPQCPKRSDSELRMAIDRYLSNLRDSVPGITPDYLREMREALLADPEAAAMLLCNNGF